MKALILAGGRGSRLNKVTEEVNKSMILLFEKPLLEYSLDNAVKLGVEEIILVVCYKKEEIINKYGNFYRGTKITYIDGAKNQEELKTKGIVDGILNAKEAIGKSDFLLMLSDEVMMNPRLKEMVNLFYTKNLSIVCGAVYEKNQESIAKTYAIITDGYGKIHRLVEKPKFKFNVLKGTGHCLFKNKILDCIEKTPINPVRKQRELVDWIQVAIDEGERVYSFKIAENYANVNTEEDFTLAKEMIRKNKPKILIVTNQMKYYGGGELLIVELCNWLTKMGVKSDILTLSKSAEVEKDLIDTKLLIIKNNINLNPPGYANIKDLFTALKLFRKSVKELEKDYDILNFHEFPTPWSLWPKKKPAVWFMNNPPNLYSKVNASKWYLALNKIRRIIDTYIVNKNIDIIAVAEEKNEKRAMSFYGRKAKLIDFGINCEVFSKGVAKTAIKKHKLEGKFVIVQSGQICAVKNQLESIKTIEKITEKIPNVILVLTGKQDKEYKEKLDRYIKEKGLGKYILFLDMFKTKQELADLYKASQIGLFPVGKQGGVLAPLECLSAGVPIIVSKGIETASLIQKHNLGIVTEDFASAVLTIFKNKEKFKDETKNAVQFIQSNLTWKAFTEKMIEAYMFAWKKHKKKGNNLFK